MLSKFNNNKISDSIIHLERLFKKVELHNDVAGELY